MDEGVLLAVVEELGVEVLAITIDEEVDGSARCMGEREGPGRMKGKRGIESGHSCEKVKLTDSVQRLLGSVPTHETMLSVPQTCRHPCARVRWR